MNNAAFRELTSGEIDQISGAGFPAVAAALLTFAAVLLDSCAKRNNDDKTTTCRPNDKGGEDCVTTSS